MSEDNKAPEADASAGSDAGSQESEAPIVWRNEKELKSTVIGTRENTKQIDVLKQELSEFKAMLKEALNSKQPAPAKPSDEKVVGVDVDAKLAAFEQRQDFVKLLEKLNVTEDQRGIIKDLYDAQKPAAANLVDWMEDKARRLTPAMKQTTQTEPVPTPKVTDTGPPHRDPAVGMGKGVFDAPAGVNWNAMSPEERRARYQYEVQKSGNANPLRRRK